MLDLQNYIKIRNGQGVSKWFKSELLKYEYNLLLDCCYIEDKNEDIDKLKRYEYYSNKNFESIVYTKSYIINDELPLFLSDKKTLYTGSISEIDDGERYKYTVYDKFIEFKNIENLEDQNYEELYGLTINTTHKRLFYFINTVRCKEFFKKLPKELKDEYNKIRKY